MEYRSPESKIVAKNMSQFKQLGEYCRKFEMVQIISKTLSELRTV